MALGGCQGDGAALPRSGSSRAGGFEGKTVISAALQWEGAQPGLLRAGLCCGDSRGCCRALLRLLRAPRGHPQVPRMGTVPGQGHRHPCLCWVAPWCSRRPLALVSPRSPTGTPWPCHQLTP